MRSLAVIGHGIIFLLPTLARAGHLHPEKDYQEAWCAEHGGETEYRLPDQTRVDCLTSTHAVEVDFAPKWAESVGQTLYYAEQTGMCPGILLIMEGEGDDRYLKRVKVLALEYDIDLWTMSPDDLRPVPIR
jgi:hypothetical protein